MTASAAAPAAEPAPAAAADRLPAEILGLILDLALEPELFAATLVSVTWNRIATPRLYRRLGMLAGPRLAKVVACLGRAWQVRLSSALAGPSEAPAQAPPMARFPYPGRFVQELECGGRFVVNGTSNGHFRGFVRQPADHPGNAHLIQLMILLSTQPGGMQTTIASLRLFHGFFRDFVVRQVFDRCAQSLRAVEATGADEYLCELLQGVPTLETLSFWLFDDSAPSLGPGSVGSLSPLSAAPPPLHEVPLFGQPGNLNLGGNPTLHGGFVNVNAPPFGGAGGLTVGGLVGAASTERILQVRTHSGPVTLPALKRLLVGSESLSRVSLLVNAPTLTHLSLASVHLETAHLFALLSQCHHSLQRISLIDVVGSSFNTDDEDLLTALTRLSSLRSVVLHSPADLGPFDLIEHLPPLAASVSHLDIEHVGITGTAMSDWIADCSAESLTHLRVSQCAEIDMAGMMQLAMSCSLLTSLSLLALPAVTSQVLAAFVARSPRIEKLCLAELDQVDDRVIAEWAGLVSPSQHAVQPGWLQQLPDVAAHAAPTHPGAAPEEASDRDASAGDAAMMIDYPPLPPLNSMRCLSRLQVFLCAKIASPTLAHLVCALDAAFGRLRYVFIETLDERDVSDKLARVSSHVLVRWNEMQAAVSAAADAADGVLSETG
ncbi:hypothetical protein HK105_206205 [Polyrhizophydium stewartii]|uniref:F-box domain-containing protein n=1 Tax=Polyrhizophydium stewartii TaxID=2732419 RepID=A0ABR4N425_9FUNG